VFKTGVGLSEKEDGEARVRAGARQIEGNIEPGKVRPAGCR
jgi:hypothetical protein